MTREVETAGELWEELTLLGKFQKTCYDKSLLQEIRDQLGLKRGEPLETKLQSTAPEALLSAFFQAVRPLSQMYGDILGLYKRFDAIYGDENVQLAFNRDVYPMCLLGLEHFLHGRKVLKRGLKMVDRWQFTPESIRRLWGLRIHDREPVIHSGAFQAWHERYHNDRSAWPEVALDLESLIAASPIRDRLERAFQFWTRLFEFYRSCSPSRHDLHDIRLQCEDKELAALLLPETDLVLGGGLMGLYDLAEHYPDFSEAQQATARRRLDKLLHGLRREQVWGQGLVECMEEFLSLPVWKHRYEVYSVWVFTRLVAPFPDEYMTFHIKNGVLEFPFGGARLATLDVGGRAVEFWTELRTAACAPLMPGGRTTGVQPDYSIVCGAAYVPENTLAVVECKQYERGGTRNFSNAVIDYARNRPNAKVALASYGKIVVKNVEKRVRDELGAGGAGRTTLFQECRPEAGACTATALSDWVIGAIYGSFIGESPRVVYDRGGKRAWYVLPLPGRNP